MDLKEQQNVFSTSTEYFEYSIGKNSYFMCRLNTYATINRDGNHDLVYGLLYKDPLAAWAHTKNERNLGCS